MNHFKSLIAFLVLIGISTGLQAQCAMCRAVVESEVAESGAAVSEGINTGILYLMGFPYLLIIAVAAYIFREKLKGLLVKS